MKLPLKTYLSRKNAVNVLSVLGSVLLLSCAAPVVVSDCASFEPIDWPPVSQEELEEQVVGHNSVMSEICLDQ